MNKIIPLLTGFICSGSLIHAEESKLSVPQGWLTRATVGYAYQADASMDQGGDLGRDVAAFESSVLYNQIDYGYQASI